MKNEIVVTNSAIAEASTFLKRKWGKKFGIEFDGDGRETRILPLSDDPSHDLGFARVIYSEKLEKWYESPECEKRYEKPACFFCDEHDEYHRITRAKKLGHMNIFPNLKFAMRNHYLIAPNEHRDVPSFSDIVLLERLAEISGLTIFGNLSKESGASFPIHVHYQTLETEFPIISRPFMAFERGDGFVVDKIIGYPALIFRFSPIGRKGRSWAKSPIQAAVVGKDIYFIPRTKAIPALANGFKFAAAEVCGEIHARNRENFANMGSGSLIATCIRDVSYGHEGPESERLQEELFQKIKETR